MQKVNKNIGEPNITHNQKIVPSKESVRKNIKVEKSAITRSKTMKQ